MENFIENKLLKEVIELATTLYDKGWDERNGGNISVILDDGEKYFKDVKAIKTFETNIANDLIEGRYILVTGTGKFFRKIKKYPEECLGVIRIKNTKAELVWGLKDGAPTSELPTHLLSHIERLKIDPTHRVVIHTHPTHLIALSLMAKPNEDEITKILWKVQTESIVVFPEGVGYLPWMVCGGLEIGKATAEKIKDYHLVMWGMHGVFGVGDSIDNAFGLIETADKAAEIYCLTNNGKDIKQCITDEQLKAVAKAFNVKYKPII